MLYHTIIYFLDGVMTNRVPASGPQGTVHSFKQKNIMVIIMIVVVVVIIMNITTIQILILLMIIIHESNNNKQDTASGRGRNKQGRRRSAAIPPNELSFENVSNMYQTIAK